MACSNGYNYELFLWLLFFWISQLCLTIKPVRKVLNQKIKKVFHFHIFFDVFIMLKVPFVVPLISRGV